jgi:hypothetical protein
MRKLTQDAKLRRTNPMPNRAPDRRPLAPRFCRVCAKGLWVLLLAGTMMLAACGGGSTAQTQATLSGDWQFTMANPPDGSFSGGLQGGFLLQNKGSVKGGAVYSISAPNAGTGGWTVCNNGSATIAGTVTGEAVTLIATAGSETFTLTGTLSFDGSTMGGTYNATAATSGSTTCGTAQTGLQWSASLVPPLTGALTGSFHSTSNTSNLDNQDFPLTGSLSQAANTGASSAAITGTLSFANVISNSSDYPCLSTVAVNGQISGNTVVLELNASGGSNLGQIGASATFPDNSPVTFDSVGSAYILHSASSPAYAVNTITCPTQGANPGDSGNICLALGNATACQEPITLTPAVLTFPAQTVGTTSTAQTIALQNNSSATQSFYFTWSSSSSGSNANFTASDNCAPGGTSSLPSSGNGNGASFPLNSAQSCVITVTFNPQVSGSLTAALTVNGSVSSDNDTAFEVPITGTASGAGAVSAPELNFGAEGRSQEGLPQWLPLTDRGGHSVGTLLSSSNSTFQDEEHHAEIK